MKKKKDRVIYTVRYYNDDGVSHYYFSNWSKAVKHANSIKKRVGEMEYPYHYISIEMRNKIIS